MYVPPTISNQNDSDFFPGIRAPVSTCLAVAKLFDISHNTIERPAKENFVFL
jgi:hypothetical protein